MKVYKIQIGTGDEAVHLIEQASDIAEVLDILRNAGWHPAGKLQIDELKDKELKEYRIEFYMERIARNEDFECINYPALKFQTDGTGGRSYIGKLRDGRVEGYVSVHSEEFYCSSKDFCFNQYSLGFIYEVQEAYKIWMKL